uniref:Wall-associated receptor kinase galacturonan-binding domain-containing protein n=1 Tax=Nelumbo nucifera TaxID=4432 RepID=A0A822Z8D8_NELNU|nr:TPA_asm: hypothetical protein HUJ06_000864 [Nelumbo nucifera]
MAKPGCQEKCGNVTVPYPFGMVDDQNCYRYLYEVTCNHSFNPPKLFLGTNGNVEVLEISSSGTLRVKTDIGYDCYNNSENVVWSLPSFDLMSMQDFKLIQLTNLKQIRFRYMYLFVFYSEIWTLLLNAYAVLFSLSSL